jgi:dTDP-4-dehydrorhamnose 3,5-epimerase
MQVERLLNDVLLITPKVFQDHRGHFFESFRDDIFSEYCNEKIVFVQDNQSLSNKGILRGLHFQNPPHAQGKLVRVVKGAVIDVAVDIRKDSINYGKHVAVELSENNFKMLFVPPGFAHGFVTLEDQTIFNYKCTDYYHPESESGIAWDSQSLNINWGISDPILSQKDLNNIDFDSFNSPF